jgi:large subunit ribosomal protein L25
MDTFALTVENREASGHKVRHLREEGMVPAVVYGAGLPTRMIQIEKRAVDTLLERGGATHLIDLEGPDMPKSRVLIREVQRHPVRRAVLHVDFVRVAAGAKVRMNVPVVMVGVAPATAGGAIVLQNMDTVEVECFPDDLPEHVEIDLSGLQDIHSRITLADLQLPKGVTLLGEHMDEAVVTVTVPRAVSHAEEGEEEAAEGEPEVIKKGKEEEE